MVAGGMPVAVLQARARGMRRAPTSAERQLWALLPGRRFGACKFRRQQVLGSYIVDFVCLERRLIVEADGGQHCESGVDAVRTRWLERQGFRVLRFWNHEILGDRRAVSDRLFAALEDPSPRSPAASRPLPQGEREEGGVCG